MWRSDFLNPQIKLAGKAQWWNRKSPALRIDRIQDNISKKMDTLIYQHHQLPPYWLIRLFSISIHHESTNHKHAEPLPTKSSLTTARKPFGP
jgi:hypothetical protein